LAKVARYEYTTSIDLAVSLSIPFAQLCKITGENCAEAQEMQAKWMNRVGGSLAPAQQSREDQYREIRQGGDMVESCNKLGPALVEDCISRISLLLTDKKTKDTTKLGLSFLLWIRNDIAETIYRQHGDNFIEDADLSEKIAGYEYTKATGLAKSLSLPFGQVCTIIGYWDCPKVEEIRAKWLKRVGY
jgi:hypothetical protein